ncbi:hypothetical protein LINPERPRIM_LOCUS4751, partial [Linum perenne]
RLIVICQRDYFSYFIWYLFSNFSQNPCSCFLGIFQLFPFSILV